MSRRWVVDASPLILLAKTGHLAFLTGLSDELVIPQPVAEEVRAGAEDDPARLWLFDAGGSYVRAPEPVVASVAAWDLGRGESAVLSWAHQREGWVALVDDLAARRCAQALEVAFTGTVGVVLAAKEAGLIPQASPVLAHLVQAGLLLSLDVLEAARRLAGEL